MRGAGCGAGGGEVGGDRVSPSPCVGRAGAASRGKNHKERNHSCPANISKAPKRGPGKHSTHFTCAQTAASSALPTALADTKTCSINERWHLLKHLDINQGFIRSDMKGSYLKGREYVLRRINEEDYFLEETS